jgi:hypothetical protein
VSSPNPVAIESTILEELPDKPGSIKKIGKSAKNQLPEMEVS